MLFAVQCRDAAGVEALRDRLLDEHKTYLKNQAHTLVVGGALLDASGRPAGSLYIINAKDTVEAERFSNGDPFTRERVFASINISAMRKSHWHPEIVD